MDRRKQSWVPTEEQKRGGLQHVRYEIRQLAGLYRTHFLPPNELLANALVESQVIHLAILYEFFTRDGKGRSEDRDDIVACDFGFQACSLGIDKSQIDPIKRRHKEIAHLTYSRRPPDQRDWNFEKLTPPVLSRAREFIDHLLDSTAFVTAAADRDEWARLRDWITRTALASSPREALRTAEPVPPSMTIVGPEVLGRAPSLPGKEPR